MLPLNYVIACGNDPTKLNSIDFEYIHFNFLYDENLVNVCLKTKNTKVRRMSITFLLYEKINNRKMNLEELNLLF